ncbi:MAG: glycosyltransferase family 4 protein [Desulfobacteraceae bacterium]|nr:glycosyltransferase family 4 protein [Desulfobacteraceae bacterium]
MNILITLPSLDDPGGVAGYFRAVLPRLRTESCRVEVIEIGSTQSCAGALHPLLDPLRLFLRLIRGETDLLHVNPSMNFRSFFRDSIFVLIAALLRIPVLVFFHGWDEKFANRVDHGFRRFFRTTYGRAGGFIVLARDVKEQLRMWRITAPIHLATTAVEDLGDGQCAPDFASGGSKGEARPLRVLFLSRIVREKGIFEAIDACGLLSSRSVPVLLTIAGEGPELDEARNYARLRLGANARFTGYVTGSAKTEVFANSDVYLFPSYTEGMPVSVLEAMAMGLPVIARRVGGLKDFFDHGKMGFITDSMDPQVFAEYLQILAEDKRLREEMSRYNAEYARKHFFASRASAALREIYTTLARGTGKPGQARPRSELP